MRRECCTREYWI